MADATQLPLALTIADHSRFDTFVGAANEAAVEHVRAVVAGRPDALWLWGAQASGKTHLLQAACRAAAAEERRAMYVPLQLSLDPDILGGLDDVDLLAVDNVERVAGADEWERALFVLLNGVTERRRGLLLGARAAPAAVGFKLPDLASRAGGAVGYRLKPLDDGERLVALRGHAAARGLELERAAAEYLLARVDRDMAALRLWLERLDRASLAEQRKITIPFIRELLAAGGARDE